MSEPDKNPAQEVPPEDDGTMSLTAHLEELRARIIRRRKLYRVVFPRRNYKLVG